jgi:Asp-tRNA(Asn)/Glu-tRNA(Gln) amidotransferase A subunit family amidase
MDFRATTLADLVDDVAARRVSARELVSGALARIEELSELNAFVAVDAESALAEAEAVDERLAAGDDAGPLAGIPIGVKDLEDAAGFVTTFGSAAHENDAPAAADSLLVERLRAAGCIVLGKTNTPEIGWKGDTDNAVFGPTLNPWNTGHSPGGSSGGSAAAIAAGLVPLCTGSDGGGSIRIPSSICGLSGMKTSLGRVPAGGLSSPGWGHLSHKGPMALRIRDVVLALDAVIGPDPSDIRSLPMPEASWSRSLEDPHPPRRVAWSPTLGYAPVDSEVLAVCEAAVKVLEHLGTEVVVVDEVWPEDPGQAWLTLVGVYNVRTLGPYRDDPAVWDRVDPGLKTIIEWADSSVSAVDFAKAEDRCHQLNLRLVELFHDCSALLTPTVAGQPPAIGGLGTFDGVEDPNWIRFTYPFNMTRSPAGTVCAGFTPGGLPVGLQVVGPQHADVAVLRLLAVLEDALAVTAVAPV